MIFVDTGPFIGRYLAKDQHHNQAIITWKKIQKAGLKCCTSNFVLDETFTLLSRWGGNYFAYEKAKLIYESELFTILRPSLEDELDAIALLEKFSDQKISFTVCISFILMRKKHINTTFSFDRHFEIAGFKIME